MIISGHYPVYWEELGQHDHNDSQDKTDLAQNGTEYHGKYAYKNGVWELLLCSVYSPGIRPWQVQDSST